MKIGIATRARITDYSLPYVASVQTVWWTLWLSHLPLDMLLLLYVCIPYLRTHV